MCELDRPVADGQQAGVGKRVATEASSGVSRAREPDPRRSTASSAPSLTSRVRTSRASGLRAGSSWRNAFSAKRATAPLTPPVSRRPTGEVAAVAALPELEQGGREQRKASGLALDVGHQPVGELRLDEEPGLLGGTLDRAAQLVACERRNEHVVGGEDARELRVLGAAAVLIGPQREDHDPAARAPRAVELADERGSLGLALQT